MDKAIERRLVVVLGNSVSDIDDSAAASVEQGYFVSSGILEEKPGWELLIVGGWESGEVGTSLLPRPGRIDRPH